MWFSFSDCFSADFLAYIWVGDVFLCWSPKPLHSSFLGLSCAFSFGSCSEYLLGLWSFCNSSCLHVQCNIYFLGNSGFCLSVSFHMLHSRMELHFHTLITLIPSWALRGPACYEKFFFFFFLFSTSPGFCEDFEVLEVSRIWKWTALSNLCACPCPVPTLQMIFPSSLPSVTVGTVWRAEKGCLIIALVSWQVLPLHHSFSAFSLPVFLS